MRQHVRLSLAALAAAAILATAVSAASANRLSTSAIGFRIVWTPLTFDAGGNTARCNLTLEGSFHSATVRKVVNALIGYVSRASLNTCAGGSATILQETLPWHVIYNSFTGTLPTISGVKFELIGASWRFQPSGLPACLARTTIEEPASSIAELVGGRATGIRADENSEIALEGFFCSFAGEGHFIGRGAITRLAETGSITIRLI